VLLPLGIFDRYGLFGVVSGLNINFSKSMFVGLEGKYIWAELSFGGQDIKLNGFITTTNLGFRF
jgi:hypothetical protein